MRINPLPLGLPIALCMLLSGCGLKGNLYLRMPLTVFPPVGRLAPMPATVVAPAAVTLPPSSVSIVMPAAATALPPAASTAFAPAATTHPRP